MEGLSWTLYLAEKSAPKTLPEMHIRLEYDLPWYCRGEFRNTPEAGIADPLGSRELLPRYDPHTNEFSTPALKRCR